jgi:hypothetical protein
MKRFRVKGAALGITGYMLEIEGYGVGITRV